MLKNKRVLFLTSTFPRGTQDSTPRFILDLAKSFQKYLSCEVEVIAPHAEAQPSGEMIEGVSVLRFRYAWPASLEQISGNGIVPRIKKNPLLVTLIPLFVCSEFVMTLRRMNRFRPDILVCCWLVPQGVVGVILKFLFPKTKVITLAPGGDAALIGAIPIVGKVVRWALNRSEAMVSISRFTEKQIVDVLGEIRVKKMVIPMGVDFSKVLSEAMSGDSAPSSHKNLLFVGRLVEKKGLDRMILAMPKILQVYPDLTLTVVGGGPKREAWESLAKQTGVSKSIRFVGSVVHQELNGYYKAATMMVVPSVRIADDFEGLSVVILEAMAIGLPVLATDAGGFSDVIIHEQTGEIVANGSSSALEEGVLRLLKNSEALTRYSQNAKKLVMDSFTYEAIATRYASLL